jgi:hypothetical protein
MGSGGAISASGTSSIADTASSGRVARLALDFVGTWLGNSAETAADENYLVAGLRSEHHSRFLSPSHAAQRRKQELLYLVSVDTRSSFQVRKQFVFEKKNQKTLVHLDPAYPEKPKPKQTEVFCFFFQKRRLSLALKFEFPSTQGSF